MCARVNFGPQKLPPPSFLLSSSRPSVHRYSPKRGGKRKERREREAMKVDLWRLCFWAKEEGGREGANRSESAFCSENIPKIETTLREGKGRERAPRLRKQSGNWDNGA